MRACLMEKHAYNIWRLNSDPMKANNAVTASSEATAPKRSLFSYLCPCFTFNSNHTLKEADKRSMNHTEDSTSTLPFDHIKPKESLTEAHPDVTQEQLDLPQKYGKQSGIYITFKEDQSEKEEKSEYADMQEEYDRYLRQQSKPKRRQFPINSLRENQLMVVGTRKGRMLCKIKSVFIDPSESARKKQAESQKSKEKASDPVIEKFWEKRYFLFEKFDEGIKLDHQSWFSVTPQAVAEHIAARLAACESVLDGFCGAGGDSIQLARHCKRVMSNDIDPLKIHLLRNNAAVYGADNIETSSSDFFHLEFKRNEFEAVYMSPPWGGPEYHKLDRMMPGDFIPPLGMIISKSLALSDNVALLLPKNTDIESIPELIYRAFQEEKILGSCSMQLEKIYFDGNFKFIMLYLGTRINKISLSDQLQYIYKLLNDGMGPFRFKRVIKKAREEVGMLRLLNLIFECEKMKKVGSTYEKLVQYLIEHEIISKDKLAKMEELDEIDAQKPTQGKKQTKQQKKMIKSLKHQQRPNEVPNIAMTQVKVSKLIVDSPIKKQNIDQTVSYVSSISPTNSITLNDHIKINQSMNHSGVKIQLLTSSFPPKE